MQKKIFFTFFLLFLSLSLQAASLICPSANWQFFRINAQYRGIIKKSFVDVGCAIAWTTRLDEHRSQMIAHITAVNPTKSKDLYSARINMLINHRGNILNIDSVIYEDFINVEGNQQTYLKDLMLLWFYMAEIVKAPSFPILQPRVKDYNYEFDVAVNSIEQIIEISALWPDYNNFSAKFFIASKGKKELVLDKFRFLGGKLVVSLVQDKLESVYADFAFSEPFASRVFDLKKSDEY